jgi:hypothetical protein
MLFDGGKENERVAGLCGQWVRRAGITSVVVHDGRAWCDAEGGATPIQPKAFARLLGISADKASLALREKAPSLKGQALVHFLSAAGWMCVDGRCPDCRERNRWRPILGGRTFEEACPAT